MVLPVLKNPFTNGGDSRQSKKESGMVLVKRKRRNAKRAPMRRAPKGRKTVARRRRRRNPARKPKLGWHRPLVKKTRKGWVGSTRGYLTSGTRINPRRRRRYVRRNPFNVKRIVSKAYLLDMATVGGGLAAGMFLMPVVDWASQQIVKDPAQQVTVSKWLGGVHVVLGFVIGGFAKNPRLRTAAHVISATGAYDLLVNALNLQDNLPPLPRTSQFSTTVLAPASEPTSGDYLPMASGYTAQQVAGDYSPAMLEGDYSDLAGDAVDDAYAIAN